jgi:hypothetical protein
MTTLEEEDNNNISNDGQRLPATEEEDPIAKYKEYAPWINKPKNIGDKLALWFNKKDHKDGWAPDKFTSPTPENPKPKRPVVDFVVKTQEDYWRKISLSPGEALEVFVMLNKTLGGEALIEMERIQGQRGGTKVKYTTLS